jgi:zinc transport system ATP-binding protein
MARDPVVSFVDADIGYDNEPVVRGLHLQVHAGEIIALLGPNGSGKSTVVRGVLGLARVQRGRVEVFGTERSRFRAWHRIGYVPQRQLAPGGIPTTVREVVNSGRLTHMRAFQPLRTEDRRAVSEAIEGVGLTDQAKTPVGELSGGQQRRALIARALASDPELLILDEPTAGVDAQNQAALAAILESLNARGTTIVLVTHEMGPVEPIITRAVALRAGRVVHDGPTHAAPDEHHGHDDEWHHVHGDPPEKPGPDLGFGGGVP